MASLCSPFATNPLEEWLGATLAGGYQQSLVAAAWYFELIANLWQEEVESDSSLRRSDHKNRDNDEVTIHDGDKEKTGKCTSAPTVAARVDPRPAHRTRWGPANPSGTSASPYRYAHNHQAQPQAEDPYQRH